MIALWMLYATLVGCLLAAAAHALEHAMGERGWPRRWVWLVAIVALPLIPLLTSELPRMPTAAHDAPAVTQPAPSLMTESGLTGRATAAVRPAAPLTRVVSAAMGAGRMVLGVAALPAAAVERAQSYLPRLARFDRFDRWLRWIWVAITSLLVGLYTAALLKLARRRRRWFSARVDGQQVLVAPDAGPAVVGVLRPAIVLPAWALGIDASRRALILRHEREHMRAHDPLMLHLVTVTAYVLPWNIAVWWMLRRLRIAVELDCDRRVLRGGGDAHQYADLLLAVGKRRSSPSRALVPALVERQSLLARRILAMCPNRGKFRHLRAACAAGAAYLMLTAAYAIPMPALANVALAFDVEPHPDASVDPTRPTFGDSSASVAIVTGAAAMDTLATSKPIARRPAARSARRAGEPTATPTVSAEQLVLDAPAGVNELAGAALRTTFSAALSPAVPVRFVTDSLLARSLSAVARHDSAASRAGEAAYVVQLGAPQLRIVAVTPRAKRQSTNQILLQDLVVLTADSATFVLHDASFVNDDSAAAGAKTVRWRNGVSTSINGDITPQSATQSGASLTFSASAIDSTKTPSR